MRYIVLALLFLFINASACANEAEAPSAQRKLPDGSTRVQYNQSDGSSVNQIHRPDGTIETAMMDTKGNETITLQHPDGSMEVKAKR